MQIAWTKHLKDPKQKEEFEALVRNSKTVLGRLKEILDEEEQGLNRSEINIQQFEKPNWEYRQAFKNGYRSCLDVMQKLLTEQQETKT